MNALIFLVLGIGFLIIHNLQKKAAVAFDLDEQTGSDYSIIVTNPPGDATDPDEWQQFFSQFDLAHVTCCTVTLDNDLLVRYLVKRRDTLMNMILLMPPEFPMDVLNISRVAADIEYSRTLLDKWFLATFQPLGLFRHMPELYSDYAMHEANIRGLAQRRYNATKVFVTFETEEGQRNTLKALSVGQIQVIYNRQGSLPSEYLFRGKHVLEVTEPDDPSGIRWEDLNTNTMRTYRTMAVTFFLDFRNYYITYSWSSQVSGVAIRS